MTEQTRSSEYVSNYDLNAIVTPVKVDALERLLREANNDTQETDFLVDGFRNRFDIQYQGPIIRKSTSRNIPFTVGDKFVLWDKIMKEVKEGRYAGPYDEILFENYMQSPIGLVPKKGGKTRLIFHLSYMFDDRLGSVNSCIPKYLCTVKYNDLDTAVKNCLRISAEAMTQLGVSTIFVGKTDLSSAFRVLPLKITCICWLVMKAEDPQGKIKFFVEKCLPFGASISCSHYQRFSNALKFLLQFRTGNKAITNYLDDFLFVAILRSLCNSLIRQFLRLCQE